MIELKIGTEFEEVEAIAGNKYVFSLGISKAGSSRFLVEV